MIAHSDMHTWFSLFLSLMNTHTHVTWKHSSRNGFVWLMLLTATLGKKKPKWLYILCYYTHYALNQALSSISECIQCYWCPVLLIMFCVRVHVLIEMLVTEWFLHASKRFLYMWLSIVWAHKQTSMLLNRHSVVSGWLCVLYQTYLHMYIWMSTQYVLLTMLSMLAILIACTSLYAGIQQSVFTTIFLVRLFPPAKTKLTNF